MMTMLIILLALAVLGNVLLTVVLLQQRSQSRKQHNPDQLREQIREDVRSEIEDETDMLSDQLRVLQGEVSRTTVSAVRDLGGMLAETQRQSAEAQQARLDAIDRAGATRQKAANDAVIAQLAMLENRLKNLETTNAAHMNAMRTEMSRSLQQMRVENAQKLEDIRGTVDEKLQDTLQKRINDSFRSVSQQLEQVYKGLGEMQTLAGDVGSLKQVLSGVKTRGILGEVQLSAILQEILAPGQYDTNVATVPGSSNRVEFAVKLPGQNGTVYLPIDSKFPGDTYAHLQQALAEGDAQQAAAARKALQAVLKAEARDIRDKYIEVPYTTNFAILFLPFEGLYAEVVNSNMIEPLQREFRVNVAGPSTMAALLNSLQMGFRTLAIQKRSGEVWAVLGAVKTEFEKFGAGLQQMQRHLNQTGNDLEELIGTRTRAIHRKLASVQQLEPEQAEALLGLGEPLPELPELPSEPAANPRLRRSGSENS